MPDRHPAHLVHITRPDLGATNTLLREACRTRGVALVEVEAGRAAASALAASIGGRLLYRSATDFASIVLEKLLFGPGVAALHDPHFPCELPLPVLQRAGVPIPRTVHVPSREPDELAGQIDWLGGFPVVVKLPGMEGGRGVHLATSLEDAAGFLKDAPTITVVQSFVAHQRCFRLLVLGGAVIAATASVAAAADFRSNGPGARDLGATDPPDGAADIACRAVAALRLDFGGVDLMQAEDGSLLVAEVNFPCYFAHQQQATGRDLAGAIVDHLLAKYSRRNARSGRSATASPDFTRQSAN